MLRVRFASAHLHALMGVLGCSTSIAIHQ